MPTVTDATLSCTRSILAFKRVKVIKSFEAATKVLAAILACKAVSSVVNALTLVVSLACKAVSSVVNALTLVVSLACKAASAASAKTTLAALLDSTAVTLADTTFTFEFKRVKVIKSLEAATKVLAAILACKAVSSVVNALTLVVSLACRAVSSVVNALTLVVSLACKAVSSLVNKVTLATRLVSTASVLADTTLMLAFNWVKVIKSLAADVAPFKFSIVIFLVVSPPTSTIGRTSLSATSTAASSVNSVIFTFAILAHLQF